MYFGDFEVRCFGARGDRKAAIMALRAIRSESISAARDALKSAPERPFSHFRGSEREALGLHTGRFIRGARHPRSLPLTRIALCGAATLFFASCAATRPPQGTRVHVEAGGRPDTTDDADREEVSLFAPANASFGDVWATLRARHGSERVVANVGLADEWDASVNPNTTSSTRGTRIRSVHEEHMEASQAVGVLVCPRATYVPTTAASTPWDAEAVMALPTTERLERWLRERANMERVIVAVDAQVLWSRVDGLLRLTRSAGYSEIGLMATQACERLAPGPPTGLAVHGSLSSDQVVVVVHTHRDEIDACRGASTASALPSGTLTVRFIIAPGGVVTTAVVVGHSLPQEDLTLEACVTGAIRTWTFPETTTEGITIVNYPLEL